MKVIESAEIEKSRFYPGFFYATLRRNGSCEKYSFMAGPNCLVAKNAVYIRTEHRPPIGEEFDIEVLDFDPCFLTTKEKTEETREAFRKFVCD